MIYIKSVSSEGNQLKVNSNWRGMESKRRPSFFEDRPVMKCGNVVRLHHSPTQIITFN